MKLPRYIQFDKLCTLILQHVSSVFVKNVHLTQVTFSLPKRIVRETVKIAGSTISTM